MPWCMTYSVLKAWSNMRMHSRVKFHLLRNVANEMHQIGLYAWSTSCLQTAFLARCFARARRRNRFACLLFRWVQGSLELDFYSGGCDLRAQ